MPANCCTSYLRLACTKGSNATFTLPFNAAITGVYKVVLFYLGSTLSYDAPNVAGQPMVVSFGSINENLVFRFYILDPNGDRVIYATDDCFEFRTSPIRIGTPYVPPVAGDCLPVAITNSSHTFSHSAAPGASYQLPDIAHTDSDGSTVILAAQTPFVATLCAAQCLADVVVKDWNGTVVGSTDDIDPCAATTVIHITYAP